MEFCTYFPSLSLSLFPPLDTVRSGSSCSGSLSSSGGDRSPGGYLRLDPNLPISSQFHDYFCNPFVVSSSSSPSSNLNGPKTSSQHHQSKQTNSSPGRTVGARRQSKSVFGLSPGPRNISISESSDGGGLSELDSINGQPGVIVYSGSLSNVPPRPSSTTSSTGTIGRSRNSKLDPETSSRHREMHKTLEKNRRAQLRTCFEELRKELPKSDYSYKKSSHINIIHSAIRYIHILKRNESEQEKLYAELLKEKHSNEQQLGRLKNEFQRANGSSRKVANSNPGTNLSNNCLTGGPAVSELIGALLKRAESKASGKSHHPQLQLQSQATEVTKSKEETKESTTVANVIASDDDEDDDDEEGEGHQLLIEERGEDEHIGDEDDETTTTASGMKCFHFVNL